MDENIVKNSPLDLVYSLFIKGKFIEWLFFCKPCIINRDCVSRLGLKTGNLDVADLIYIPGLSQKQIIENICIIYGS